MCRYPILDQEMSNSELILAIKGVYGEWLPIHWGGGWGFQLPRTPPPVCIPTILDPAGQCHTSGAVLGGLRHALWIPWSALLFNCMRNLGMHIQLKTIPILLSHQLLLQTAPWLRPTRGREECTDTGGVLTVLYHTACTKQQLEEPAAQWGNVER